MDMTTITIDPSRVLGPVKPMNAVNNGPIKTRRDQSRGNFAAFRDARIPFARTHDSVRCVSGCVPDECRAAGPIRRKGRQPRSHR